MIKRSSDNLVVAGNGPSLANVDFGALPSDFDVFRCNQFYCEDKYYLGKNIKLVMFNPSVIYHQLKTIHELSKRDEYNIEHVCLNYASSMWDPLFDLNKFKLKMPFVYILKDLLDEDILKELCLYNFCDYSRPTSGVLLMLLGYSLGYKNIYFTGLDFAINGNQDQLNLIKNSNIDKYIYIENNNFGDMHNKETDLYYINKYNFIQLNTTANQIKCISKNNNYINDIIISQEHLKINNIVTTPPLYIKFISCFIPNKKARRVFRKNIQNNF